MSSEPDPVDTPEPILPFPTKRVAAAFAIAFAFILGVYVLLDATQPDAALISFSFLLILPTAVAAFISYVADPLGVKPQKFHMMIPIWLMLAVITASVFILREGTICIVMLSPLWIAGAYLGSWLMYRFHRNRTKEANRMNASALLLVPLLAMQIEPYIPLPQANASVSRSIIVDARPNTIWPLLEGVPDVQPDEGQWNVTQDVMGVPRPLGARLVGKGVGAARLANWSNAIKFREVINDWEPGKRIGWRFIFDDLNGWAFTDRHLMPDSQYFRITTGGYALTPLKDGTTRVTLTTNYWMQTPVNGYSGLWGELFLGDIHDNLLAMIKARAESRSGAAR